MMQKEIGDAYNRLASQILTDMLRNYTLGKDRDSIELFAQTDLFENYCILARVDADKLRDFFLGKWKLH